MPADRLVKIPDNISDEVAAAQIAYDELYNSFMSGTVVVSAADLNSARSTITNADAARIQAQNGMIGCSVAAGVVWLWNIYDMKKQAKNKYSDSISVGSTPNGQIMISFPIN